MKKQIKKRQVLLLIFFSVIVGVLILFKFNIFHGSGLNDGTKVTVENADFKKHSDNNSKSDNHQYFEENIYLNEKEKNTNEKKQEDLAVTKEEFNLTTIDLENLRNPFQNIIDESLQNQASSIDIKEKETKNLSTVYEQYIREDTTYSDLLSPNEMGATLTEREYLDIRSVVSPPPFLLKGIVYQVTKKRAILVYNTESYIIGEGERIDEWVIEDIMEDKVVIKSETGQYFIFTLEGMILNENTI